MNEPEFEDIEITLDDADRWLGVYHREYRFLPNGFTCLGDLPSLPNFECFHLKAGLIINLVHVASYYAKKKEVYAKFRK